MATPISRSRIVHTCIAFKSLRRDTPHGNPHAPPSDIPPPYVSIPQAPTPPSRVSPIPPTRYLPSQRPPHARLPLITPAPFQPLRCVSPHTAPPQIPALPLHAARFQSLRRDTPHGNSAADTFDALNIW